MFFAAPIPEPVAISYQTLLQNDKAGDSPTAANSHLVIRRQWVALCRIDAGRRLKTTNLVEDLITIKATRTTRTYHLTITKAEIEL